MKNSSLEKLRTFEMPRSMAKTVNGRHNLKKIRGQCRKTARRDGNDFLIGQCNQIGQ